MASINMAWSMIGGGKSLFMTKRICRELEFSERRIVTNVPLNVFDAPPGFVSVAEYCHDWISKPVNLSQRLMVLDDDMVEQFWRFLPTGPFDGAKWIVKQQQRQFRVRANETPADLVTDVERSSDEWELRTIEQDWYQGAAVVLPLVNDKRGRVVTDFGLRGFHERNADGNGVLYIIDEAHLYFGSREWQKVAPSMEHYMSQIRKLNDDVWFVTQHPGKLDKNLQRNTTDWWQVVNWEKTPLVMGVTFKNRFRALHYMQNRMPERGDKPESSFRYRLRGKRRHELLYRTMAGTAIEGTDVAEEKSFKGRSPVVWVVLFLGIVVGAHYLPLLIEKSVAGVVGGSVGGFQAGMRDGLASRGGVAPVKVPVSAVVSGSPAGVVAVPAAAASVKSGVEYQTNLWCVNVTDLAGNYCCMLSDGRVAWSGDGDVQEIQHDFVRVFGEPPIRRRAMHVLSTYAPSRGVGPGMNDAQHRGGRP